MIWVPEAGAAVTVHQSAVILLMPQEALFEVEGESCCNCDKPPFCHHLPGAVAVIPSAGVGKL